MMRKLFGEKTFSITPAAITVIYLMIGGFWILFSDQLVLFLTTTHQAESFLQTIKGWIYVAVTGALLYLLTSWNIAELKKRNKELRVSEEKYRSLVFSTSAVVWTTDAQGKSIDTLQWSELTGQTFEDARNGGWLKALHPQDRERAKQVWEKALQTKSLYEAEYQIKKRDGSYGSFVVRAAPIFDEEGSIREWVGVFIDVSERRFLEQQLRQSQKMEAIGQLTSGIAHDFNNLLTAIIGYSDLAALQSQRGKPVERNIEEIKKAAERASQLTHQLLAFSRKQVLQPEVLNLNKVIANIENMLRRLIGENIELEIKLEPELKNVLIDPGQIEQVIVNLAVNARDAMPKGGKLRIETANASHVELTELEQPNSFENCVVLTLSDTGSGMDERTQAHIFEPFFTTKEVGKGTGLGLSTVYGIVKQSGGSVRFDSRVGQGTTFYIYLPNVEI